jgi:hypothetical protein
MLGIFVVLAILLKNLTAPIYPIITILISYFTMLGISYLVFQVGLGKEGLSWSVPFFSFCLLMPALAVKIGELNFWPGRKMRILPVENSGDQQEKSLEA